MVTNLTNYGKQIRFMLSTDDPTEVEWQNGDLVFLMDQDKLYVFDADNFTFKEISMGGGGSSSIEAPYKVSSGTFTIATSNRTIRLPLGDITTPIMACAYMPDYADYIGTDDKIVGIVFMKPDIQVPHAGTGINRYNVTYQGSTSYSAANYAVDNGDLKFTGTSTTYVSIVGTTFKFCVVGV